MFQVLCKRELLDVYQSCMLHILYSIQVLPLINLFQKTCNCAALLEVFIFSLGMLFNNKRCTGTSPIVNFSPQKTHGCIFREVVRVTNTKTPQKMHSQPQTTSPMVPFSSTASILAHTPTHIVLPKMLKGPCFSIIKFFNQTDIFSSGANNFENNKNANTRFAISHWLIGKKEPSLTRSL